MSAMQYRLIEVPAARVTAWLKVQFRYCVEAMFVVEKYVFIPSVMVSPARAEDAGSVFDEASLTVRFIPVTDTDEYPAGLAFESVSVITYTFCWLVDTAGGIMSL